MRPHHRRRLHAALIGPETSFRATLPTATRPPEPIPKAGNRSIALSASARASNLPMRPTLNKKSLSNSASVSHARESRERVLHKATCRKPAGPCWSACLTRAAQSTPRPAQTPRGILCTSVRAFTSPIRPTCSMKIPSQNHRSFLSFAQSDVHATSGASLRSKAPTQMIIKPPLELGGPHHPRGSAGMHPLRGQQTLDLS